MALEQRENIFNFSSSLSAGCTALDTTLTCSGFSQLPVLSGGSQYVPLVLANDSLGKEEVVYVTAHTSGAITATVLRGQDGTAPQTFAVNDVVRCSPTTRDVATTLSPLASPPTNPYVGMKWLQTDNNVVVTYTPFGWVDEATVKNDPGRKHQWFQGTADIATMNSMITVAGLPSAQVGTAGTIATQSAGSLTLNKAGLWTIGCQMFEFSTLSRNQGVQLTWTGGAFPGQTTLFQIEGVIGGSGTAGNGLVSLNWTGYVPAAAALAPIVFAVWSTVTTTGGSCNYHLFAEYLGG